MNKLIGKIENYNGVTGVINSDNELYSFTFTSLISDLKIGDIVWFTVANNEYKIATDVELYKELDLDQVLSSIYEAYKKHMDEYNNAQSSKENTNIYDSEKLKKTKYFK